MSFRTQSDDSDNDVRVARTPFLLVSWSMPPTATGSSVIVKNLAQQFDPSECVLLGQELYEGRIDLDGIGEHVRIRVPSVGIHWRIDPYISPLVIVPAAVSAGIRAVKQYNLRAVVTVFPNAPHLMAGHLIARRMGIPHYPWYHNLFVETRTNTLERIFAQRMQRWVFRKAERILSINEGVRDYLSKHYAVESDLILPPINIPGNCEPIDRPPSKPFRIGVSGNINFTTIESVRLLINSLRNDEDYEIVIHTPLSKTTLQNSLNTWSTNIITKVCRTQVDLLDSFRLCDLLFLALDDKTGDASEWDARTQFPIRTTEMLASGKPILLLCPEEYFLAYFFRERRCGDVFHTRNCDELRKRIIALCTDVDFRKKLSSNACKAIKYFDAQSIAFALRRVLSQRVS